MKKICIVSRNDAANHRLINLLRRVFPECEIDVVTRKVDDFSPVKSDDYLCHIEIEISRNINH